MEADKEFQTTKIKSVKSLKHGYTITTEDGWSMWLDHADGLDPKVGSTMLTYGKGVGHAIRGVVIDGVVAYYRTEEEDREHHIVSTYGADAAEWVSRWDDGKAVWTITMGGLGPGYEQALQIAVVELVRFYLGHGLMPGYNDVAEYLGYLGLSGSQWNAALSLARIIASKGPRAIGDYPDERRIMVSKTFPEAPNADS